MDLKNNTVVHRQLKTFILLLPIVLNFQCFVSHLVSKRQNHPFSQQTLYTIVYYKVSLLLIISSLFRTTR